MPVVAVVALPTCKTQRSVEPVATGTNDQSIYRNEVGHMTLLMENAWKMCC